MALKEYLNTEAKKNRNFKVNKCGLLLDHKKTYIGATPDAVASYKSYGFCDVDKMSLQY